MSDGQKPADKVREIIEGYISQNSHLLAMERIHQNFWDEEREFTNWTEVLDIYLNRSWSNEEVKELAQLSKRIVEGSDEIAESYFRIVDPKNVGLESIKEELDSSLYDAEADPGERDGFQYEIDEGIIQGRYIYTDISTEVSHAGDVNEYVSEGAIEFRILPEESLLITESTRVVDIQKTKSYFNNSTDLSLAVYADLTAHPDKALDRYDNFIQYFNQGGESNNLELLNIGQVSLHNPNHEENELIDISLEGDELLHHPKMDELLNDGWLPKGAEFSVMYRENIFKIKFSANNVMCYLKIGGIRDFKMARELMETVRNHFLQVF